MKKISNYELEEEKIEIKIMIELSCTEKDILRNSFHEVAKEIEE